MDNQEDKIIPNQETLNFFKESLKGFDDYIPVYLKNKLGVIGNIIFFTVIIFIISIGILIITQSFLYFVLSIILFFSIILLFIGLILFVYKKQEGKSQHFCKELEKMLHKLENSHDIREFLAILETILRTFSTQIKDKDKSEQLNICIDKIFNNESKQVGDDLVNEWIPAGIWLENNRSRLIKEVIGLITNKKKNGWLKDKINEIETGVNYHFDWILTNIKHAGNISREFDDDLEAYLSSKNVPFRDSNVYKEIFEILKSKIDNSETTLSPAAKELLLLFIGGIIHTHNYRLV